MKTTIEIIMETAKVFNRFADELPEKYMQEIFGKDDAVLAEKCLQSPKYGVSALLILLENFFIVQLYTMLIFKNRPLSIIKSPFRPGMLCLITSREGAS